jgi:spermidine synthase
VSVEPNFRDPRAARAHWIALALMVLSGFAALGYQIVWTQQSALWLGHETTAVLAVVAAFFGGLGLGALALGPRIDRGGSPARWYAGCEAVIGLWSLALAFLMTPASAWLLAVTGPDPSSLRQWTVAFGGTFLLLLPATAAMGATLPAMERVLAALHLRGAPIAALYAGNTFGAVLGVLAVAFWLVPTFGLTSTAMMCATLSLVCAAAVLMLPAGAVASLPPSAGGVRWLPVLAATGLLGIGFEVLVVRVLSQLVENTVYTFAMLLAVYLVGTSLGAAEYHRRFARSPAPESLQDGLLQALAVACLAGITSLWAGEWIKATVIERLGPGIAAALAAEALLAVAAFLPATLVMGALFSHLATVARAGGASLGRCLGVNTLGAAAAPLVFGVWLLPALGPKLALLLIPAAYLVLASRRAWRSPLALGAAAAGIGLAVLAPPLAFVDIPPGGRLVSYRDGAMAAVSVVEDAGGVATLRINNRQQEGSSATGYSDARQALLPSLLHPSPRRALFLGLGTGTTAAAAAVERGLEVQAVELLPEVIEASAHFIGPTGADSEHPRLSILAADARRFVRATGESYDLIVSDNFHPARSGSASLYTVEHFRAVRERLAPGGVFCQWLPLHQLDLATLGSIVRSFLDVYPEGWALLATFSLETPVLGLVAREDGARFDLAVTRERLASPSLTGSPARLGVTDELALFGSFVAGPRALARFAEGADRNTDDRPIVAYLAPRIAYAPDSRPRDRLLALISLVGLEPDELMEPTGDPRWSARLAAYWQARDRFLEAGRDVEPSPDARRMLAQVREPLLEALKRSPDFRPAYDPLLAMAVTLAETDATSGIALLTELNRLQPLRREARLALLRLGADLTDDPADRPTPE